MPSSPRRRGIQYSRATMVRRLCETFNSCDYWIIRFSRDGRPRAWRRCDYMTTELDPRAAGGKRLKGKICIVTGAGQGIGRATAKRLGAQGGIFFVADRGDGGGSPTRGGAE